MGSTIMAQNVWSLAYIDALVARDLPASPDGQLDGTGFSRGGTDGDGKLVHDLNAGSSDSGQEVAVDSQGRIIVGGHKPTGGRVLVKPDGFVRLHESRNG